MVSYKIISYFDDVIWPEDDSDDLVLADALVLNDDMRGVDTEFVSYLSYSLKPFSLFFTNTEDNRPPSSVVFFVDSVNESMTLRLVRDLFENIPLAQRDNAVFKVHKKHPNLDIYGVLHKMGHNFECRDTDKRMPHDIEIYEDLSLADIRDLSPQEHLDAYTRLQSQLKELSRLLEKAPKFSDIRTFLSKLTDIDAKRIIFHSLTINGPLSKGPIRDYVMFYKLGGFTYLKNFLDGLDGNTTCGELLSRAKQLDCDRTLRIDIICQASLECPDLQIYKIIRAMEIEWIPHILKDKTLQELRGKRFSSFVHCVYIEDSRHAALHHLDMQLYDATHILEYAKDYKRRAIEFDFLKNHAEHLIDERENSRIFG